jgi:hypothetical protein
MPFLSFKTGIMRQFGIGVIAMTEVLLGMPGELMLD